MEGKFMTKNGIFSNVCQDGISCRRRRLSVSLNKNTWQRKSSKYPDSAVTHCETVFLNRCSAELPSRVPQIFKFTLIWNKMVLEDIFYKKILHFALEFFCVHLTVEKLWTTRYITLYNLDWKSLYHLNQFFWIFLIYFKVKKWISWNRKEW